MFQEKIKESISNLQLLLADHSTLENIQNAVHHITHAIKSGNKLLICGNGGSAADAQHIAGEFLCRFYQDRHPLPAIALTTDSSILTSIGNDYSYEEVFSRQILGLGKKGDLLLGISTSGSSKNVLKGFKVAKEIEIKTILLTGNEEREIAQFSDLIIKAPSNDTPRIQEIHLLIEHLICEEVEKAFLSGN